MWKTDAINSLSNIPALLQGIGLILAGCAGLRIKEKLNRKDAPSDLLNSIIKSMIYKYYSSESGIVFSLKNSSDRKIIIDHVISNNNLDSSKYIRKLVEDNVTELLERGYY